MATPPTIHICGDHHKALRQSLANSVILTANTDDVTREVLVSAVPLPRKAWKVGYLGGRRFLVEGPDHWRAEVTRATVARFGGYTFKVQADLTDLMLPPGNDQVWVRFPELPYELRSTDTIQFIVSQFAKFIKVDDNTQNHYDLRWARAFVELEPGQVIPTHIPFSVVAGRGKIPITVDVEKETIYSIPILHKNFTKIPDKKRKGTADMDSQDPTEEVNGGKKICATGGSSVARSPSA
jgi:hypothetical protein